MTTLKIKKLHPDAIIPKYATEGAACFDIHAVGGREPDYTVTKTLEIHTGLAFEVPKGYVMLVFSRSGDGFNRNIRLANCVGVIDSDYRGELMVKLTADGVNGITFRKGDRIAQAMLVQLPFVSIEQVKELSETARGDGGFGSTGK